MSMDSVNHIKQLQERLKEREGEIVVLQQKLIEVAKDMNTETLMLQKLQADNEALQNEAMKWQNAYTEESEKVQTLEPQLSEA